MSDCQDEEEGPLLVSAAVDGLYERLLAGDHGALGELYDVFAPVVFGLALRVTRDQAAAEDVCQEVFVSLWERPDRFDPERGTLRGWLCTLAHRRAVDWVRRAEARRRRAASGPDRSAVPPPDPSAHYVAAEQRRTVARALERLPADQRHVVELTYFDGLTFRQAAERLGIPEGTAKSRIRLALAHLSRDLGASRRSQA